MNHGVIIAMSETITLLNQELNNKEQYIHEAQKRVEYLEKELARVLGEEMQEPSHDVHTH